MTSPLLSTRRLTLALAAITTTSFVASCAETESQTVLEARLSGALVISQVYGGGGNSGATYRNDFVELFNRSTTSVSLAGLSVQYASAGGAFQTAAVVSLPSVTLAPGQYFLLSLAGGSTGAALPTADATNAAVNMSGTAGKVALVDGTTAIPCTSGVCTLTDVIDYVGYGTTASQYEGTAAATAPSGNTGSVQRRLAGCMETDDNRADFESPAAMVAPRNTMSAVNVCTVATDSGTDVFVDDVVDADMDATVIDDAAADADDAAMVDVFDGGGSSPSGLVISQVFGAGGNSGAAYTNDFIELFNRGTSPASLNGLSVQYASAAGTFGMASVVALPDVVVQPGHYFLVSLAGGATGAALPTADHAAPSVNMSGTAGRVALVNGTTAIPCSSGVCIGTNVLDYVGYGTTASEFEGSAPATAGSNAQSPQRRGAGCVDTNDNRADFESPAIAANARNSSSPANDCTGVSTDAGVDVVTDVIDVDGGSVDASMDSSTGIDATVDVPATDASSGMDAIAPGSVPIVISQIYGAGGNGGATYTNDFVELFNRGAVSFSLSGLSLQYASSTGNFAAGGVTMLPDITVPAGAYFLVQMASGGTAGSALPGVDHANTAVNLSGSAGKVALVVGTTALGCGGATTCSRASIVDLVGYGSAATFYEGSGPATAPSTNTNSVQRLRAGCVDTDDNAGDFEMPVLSVRPRNSGSPLNDCTTTTIDAGVMDSGRDATVTDTGVDVRVDAPVDSTVTDAARDVAADATRDAIDDVPTRDVVADSGAVDSGSLTDARTDAPRDANRDATADAGGWTSPNGCACSTPGGNGTAPTPRTATLALGAIAAVLARRKARRA